MGAPHAAGSPSARTRFPKPSGTTSSKSAIPNTATSCRATSPPARSSTSASNEGLSVEADRQCVYLDLTHIPRDELDRKLGGILEIYEKFQGVDPRDVPMKIFPAVHYSMGGLWVDYERNGRRRTRARVAPQPADQHPRPVRDRRVRLSLPRRQSPGGQLAAVAAFSADCLWLPAFRMQSVD